MWARVSWKEATKLDLPEPVATLTLGQYAAQRRPERRSMPGLHPSVSLDGQQSLARQWRIPCQDVANRTRFLTVFVEQARVVLVGPPGETATFSAGQLIELSAALQQAADEAERQR
jgi:hypothetical protein